MRTLILLLVTLTPTVGAAAGGPPTLPNIDPLLQPPPKLEANLQYTPDLRPASEKIVPLLQNKRLESDVDTSLKVIVTLVNPIFVAKGTPGREEYDAVRARHIAALEHEFVAQSVEIGFQPSRGLKHSPVVCGKVALAELDALATLPIVRAVEHDSIHKLARVEGGNLINAPQLQSQGGLGNGIGVAVIDSGIAWDHAELSGKVTAWADYTGTQTTDPGYDDNGHGTACAGIIAGWSGGMAPSAHLWALKVCTSDGRCDTSDEVAALDAVYEYRNEYFGAHVVNMSLGGEAPINYLCDLHNLAMTLAMSRLDDVGIPIIVASGNDGCPNGISFPACISYAISVGAVYDADVGSRFEPANDCRPFPCDQPTTAADQITCYSNSGVYLDLYAPSECAVTPDIGGGYKGCFNGTSAAAPYVSGVAAQILSLRPGTTPLELLAALWWTGQPITDSWNGLMWMPSI